jgi:thioredoxin 1
MSSTVLAKDMFQNQIQSGVTLIDFWAPWCGPCQVQLPIVEELADEVKGKAVIAKVNVDEEGELAMQLGITSIPTLILFKDGNIVEKLVGLKSKQELKTKIEALLA